MGIRIHVGLSEKRGLPNFGSCGASCSAEIELDAADISEQPERFEQRVRATFAACRKAVLEQLERTPTPLPNPAKPLPPAPAEDGLSRRQIATASQLRAIRAMTRQQGVPAMKLVEQRFRVRGPEQLTTQQAGILIRELQAKKAISR